MASAVPSAFSYLDFLKALLAVGPNLGAAVAIIKQIVDLEQQAFAKLKELGTLLGVTPKLAEVSGPVALTVASVDGIEITAEVLEAENKLLALSRQHGVHASKLGDGTLLRGAWSIIQQNPWLMGEIAKRLMGLSTAA